MQRENLLKSILGGPRPAKTGELETTPDAALQDAMAALQRVMDQINGIILGKEQAVKLTLTCLLAKGHLLIEDMPGVGKTTLAQALARSLGLSFQRIQFTSDLLPADILGATIFDRDTSSFRFHPGPIFSHVLLADEVNRATPKTQSALLEAMEERQVTLDGQTHPLPDPFYVIATQNPSSQVGTFALPESQLDRFLMRVSLGFPDARAERALLAGEDRRQMLSRLGAQMNRAQMARLQEAVLAVHVSDPLLDYAQALLAHTRTHPELTHGLSPRCGVYLLRAARAWTFLEGRDFVLPDDLQWVFGPVVVHRLQLEHNHNTHAVNALLGKILAEVAVP